MSISEMVGKTPKNITIGRDKDELNFYFSDGTFGRFYHEQDCCESVFISDVSGDVADLIGTPLLVAEERIETGLDEGGWDSWTATFYTFRSIKGTVDVLWRGESNGFYSETVDFQMERLGT
jgi:hypothetical protein